MSAKSEKLASEQERADDDKDSNGMMTKYPGVTWFILTVISIGACYLCISLLFQKVLGEYIHLLLPLASSLANGYLFYRLSKGIVKRGKQPSASAKAALLFVLLFVLNYIALFFPCAFIFIVPWMPMVVIYSLLLMAIPMYDLLKNTLIVRKFEKLWMYGKMS